MLNLMVFGLRGPARNAAHVHVTSGGHHNEAHAFVHSGRRGRQCPAAHSSAVL